MKKLATLGDWQTPGARTKTPRRGVEQVSASPNDNRSCPMKSPALACLALLLAVTSHAQREERPRPPGGGDGGPAAHRVLSATSADGLTWTRDEGVRITAGSVPCAIADGDKRVLIYYVKPSAQPGGTENVACAVSTDGMHFEDAPDFRIEGLSTLKAVDPSIVRDADGAFRLYYLASDFRGDPARAQNPHAIKLALSNDGIRFRESGTVFEYDGLVDPDVFRHRDRWLMYVFGKGGTVIATSGDGEKFAFEKTMTPRDWGTTAPVALPDGRLRLYAFEQRVPAGNAVGSFLSDDGLNWTAEPGERLRADAGEQITDPFVVPWRGGWKMYFKLSAARGRANAGGPPQQQGVRPRGEFAPGQPQPRQNDGPWNRDVIAWRVGPDGAVEKAATFERAGVPTIARLKDGRLIVAHQHFPADDPDGFDKVAVHFSNDDGKTWDAAKVIRVDGLPEGMRFPFDPTLVPLPDGRVRLYFTGNMGRTFERSVPAIHSAISDDGTRYTYEPGARFAVEGRPVIDCAVALHDGVFHLYAPDNGTRIGPAPQPRPGERDAATRPPDGAGYHATSKDGLTFTRAADVRIEGRRRWLGNALSDGNRITFFGTGEPSGEPGTRPRGGLWMATSEDGQTWKLVPAPAIGGGDPGAVKTKDGGLIVVITGESVRSIPRPPARDGNPAQPR